MNDSYLDDLLLILNNILNDTSTDNGDFTDEF